ncbi:MAG: threonine-phosphate decarboxylase [Gammaproteobacteria bacterium]|nr:threonine-phosphate decarboxylase [Gammaproteobacteria bacterium]
MLEHGGRLKLAVSQYDIPLEQWMDLSTGINPNGWPVPDVPAVLWSRLPEEDDALEQAARDYYAAETLLPVAGSQAAIQALPMLRPACRVAVLSPAYAEHALAWSRAGHHVSQIDAKKINAVISQLDVLVIINPNNPTGACFSIEQLLHWHKQLSNRGGWLVVDEAFMDVTPEHSLVPYSLRPGLIVLRSLGKFFGLAGARVGFVCAQAALLEQLKNQLGPWTLSSPARWLASQALVDHLWQQSTRKKLLAEGVRLQTLLTQHGLAPDGGCALFQWLQTSQAAYLHNSFASQGILTRLFSEPSSLRFGLPGNEAQWQRLHEALAQLVEIKPVEASA